MNPMRRGFTLVEILVATSIFAVVSVAMIGIYATATDLVRLGESRRAAADEAAATLSMFDEDLRRIVPPEAGGFFFAAVPLHAPGPTQEITWDPGGSMAIAFVISDPTGFTDRTAQPQLLVLWMVDKQDRLWRRVGNAPAVGQQIGASITTPRFNLVTTWFNEIAQPTPPAGWQPVAEGCQLLAIDLRPAGATAPVPAAGQLYLTEPRTATTTSDAFPDTVTLTVAFGGPAAHAPKGRIASANGDNFRVSGIKGITTDTWLRIKTPDTPERIEWFQAGLAGGGLLSRPSSPGPFGTFRTTPGTLKKGAEVLAPSIYSLTRSVGR